MMVSQGSAMTRALILGGTADASLLAAEIARARIDAVYSYGGRTRAPANQPLPTRIGGFGGVSGLADYIRLECITHVIDATHPFAAEMSRHAVEACAQTGTPLIALERDQRRSRLRARFDRVAAHLGSKGMRRVDHMRDALKANIVGKPAHAPEAADAGRQRLIGGRAGSATIGIHGVDARACDFRGEQARIGGSAQNEGARHG